MTVVGFHMVTGESCKQLWKNCIEYHAFFRLADVDGLSPGHRGLISRSRNMYMGRTESEAIEANKAAIVERSKSVRVVR